MRSLRTRLLVMVVPIMLALLSALGILNYHLSSQIVSGAAREYLQTLLEAKQEALIENIESTGKIAAAIAASDVVQSYAEIANRDLRGRNQQVVEQLALRVQDLLHVFQENHWGRYHHIYLVNRSNRIAVSPAHGLREKGSASALLGVDLSRNRWAMEAMQKGVVAISDYRIGQSYGGSTATLYFPVRDVANRVQAVLGFELQAAYQQQIVNAGSGADDTRRIYIATAKGIPLDFNGEAGGAPLAGEAFAAARLNGIAFEHRADTHGRKLLAAYAHHQGYPWVLAVELESEKVFGALHRLQLVLVAGLATTLIVATALLLRFAGRVIGPIREAISCLDSISLGDFNVDILDPPGRDETSQLIDALQRLVQSLQVVAKKLRSARALRKAG